MTLLTGRPNPEDAPPYAKYYLDRTGPETDLLLALQNDKTETARFIRSLPLEKVDFQYAEGKWSTKSVIAHIIDTERVFQYRALRASRKDNTSLPGFDEDEFAVHANTDSRTLEELAVEFEAVRESTIQLFSYMTDSMVDFKGMASNSIITARSAGWIIVGHTRHHCGIIKERYLVEVEE